MTKEDIKNLTLTEINHETITDWEDQSNTDIPIINQQYDLAIKVALAKYPWSFATKYKQLDTNDLIPGEEYTKYKRSVSLPEDLLGYLAVYTNDTYLTLAEYNSVGNIVYTNLKKIYIKYTYKVEEEALPVEFIDWFKVFFATRLNSYINGDMQRQQYLENQEPFLFRAAKNIDSKRNKHQSLLSNPMLSIRGRLGGGNI